MRVRADGGRPQEQILAGLVGDKFPADSAEDVQFLVDLQEELRSFEDRLYEPTVGTLMDTHAAMTGDLYDLRDDLRSR